jgi:hypothetical protein
VKPFPAASWALAAAIALNLAVAGAAWAARVSGVVVDAAGKPIELATVAAPAFKQGTSTDEHGRFTLELPAGQTVLVVSEMGYEARRLTIVIAEGAADLRVTLREQPVELSEVTVAASSFGKTGKSEGATLRRMEIYTTPGGAADLFQSLRALPGINAPTEGAALYVRGGKPDETLIRLDGGSIGHPYHYERASGGLFSTLDAYMIKSAFFSSGGFSAKYGGVLSGVLDVETQDPFNLKTVSVSANVVGSGLSTSWALIPDRLSLIASIRHSYPAVLFKLYGSASEYEEAPTSDDAAGRLLYRYSKSGKLSFTWLDSGDHTALQANVLNFKGLYSGRARNRFGALQFSDALLGKVALRAQASLQRYHTAWSFASFGGDEVERVAQGNLDAVWPVNSRHELSFGANLGRTEHENRGTVGADSTDYGSGAPTRTLDTHPSVDHPGVYLEDKLRVWGPIYATLGGRFDYASLPGVWTADPRAAIAWRVDEHQTVRVATGRYHQLANVRYLDPVYGNPDLEPPSADHVIAGYEWLSEFGNVRIEAYRKDYHGLATNDSTRYYANRGTGYARGVDVFTRGTFRSLSGWVSYGYMDARRKELDDPREVPTAWGVKHSVTLVNQYQVASAWQVGARYGFSTGRHYTPVVDRTWDPARAIWRPVFGEHNSAVMPDYHRLDVRATRLFSLPRGAGMPASSVCAAYVEAMNVLAIRNPLEYVYNSDYSRRYTRDSYFSRRFLVAGVALTW